MTHSTGYRVTILGIAFIACVLFFAMPLAGYDISSGRVFATAWDMATGLGTLMGGRPGYPLIFIILVLPIILGILSLMKIDYSKLCLVAIFTLLLNLVFILILKRLLPESVSTTWYAWILVLLYMIVTGMAWYGADNDYSWYDITYFFRHLSSRVKIGGIIVFSLLIYFFASWLTNGLLPGIGELSRLIFSQSEDGDQSIEAAFNYEDFISSYPTEAGGIPNTPQIVNKDYEYNSTFPGTSLQKHSLDNNTADVMLIQDKLNFISDYYAEIPKLDVDGRFGPATEEAVIAFQKSMELEPSGIVDMTTWDYIMVMYDAIVMYIEENY